MNPEALINRMQAAAPYLIETVNDHGTTRQAFQDKARAESYEARAAACGYTTRRVHTTPEQMP